MPLRVTVYALVSLLLWPFTAPYGGRAPEDLLGGGASMPRHHPTPSTAADLPTRHGLPEMRQTTHDAAGALNAHRLHGVPGVTGAAANRLVRGGTVRAATARAIVLRI